VGFTFSVYPQLNIFLLLATLQDAVTELVACDLSVPYPLS
jgi:hypothetical protein